MSLKDWIKLILLSLIWGGSFLFVEIALTAAGTLTIVMYRVGLGALALWLFCLWRGERVMWTVPLVFGFLVMGILNNVLPFTLITFGQTEVTAGLASILNATTPLFAVVVGHYWPDGERATSLKLAGVVAGIMGIAILVGPAAFVGSDSLIGQIAILGSSVSYAFAANYGRRLLKAVSPIVSAAGMLTASTLIMVPAAMMFEMPFVALPVEVWGALLGLSLLCAAVAYILYFSILASAGPTNLMLVTFIIPVSAIALGVVFLGEPIVARQIGGLMFILAGLALVDGRAFQHLKRRDKVVDVPQR